MFRFIQSVLDPDKSECIFCGIVLSNDSMKPPKLKIHQQEPGQSTVEQDDIFFIDWKKEYMSTIIGAELGGGVGGVGGSEHPLVTNPGGPGEALEGGQGF